MLFFPLNFDAHRYRLEFHEIEIFCHSSYFDDFNYHKFYDIILSNLIVLQLIP